MRSLALVSAFVWLAAAACTRSNPSATSSSATPVPAPSDGGGAEPAAGGCPPSWTAAPAVDGALAVPAGSGGVLLRARAVGTQNYECKALPGDAGPGHAWTFVGPQANLTDCHGAPIGTHFASAAGPTAPEWLELDGTTYVIAKKLAAATPDGGAPAVPWLLLQATSTSGAGTLAKTKYVQRLNTTDGVAPASGCDATAVGQTRRVAYGADYYFYGD